MMINPELLQFLRNLEQNNEKAWFDRQKTKYQALRKEFVATLNELTERIALFDPVIQLRLGDPKLIKVFRINRDLRFSHDKRPYKTNMAGTIGFGDDSRPGYYLSIEPGNSAVGGGIYMPPAKALQAVREKVAVDYQTLSKIVNAQEFISAFPHGLTQHDALKTAPRGYSVDHPAIEFLRLKSYASIRTLTDDEVTQPSFEDTALSCFESISKLNAYLDEALQ